MHDCTPAHLLVHDDYMPSEDDEEESETVSIAESDAGSDEGDVTSVDGSNISSVRLHELMGSIRTVASMERSERVLHNELGSKLDRKKMKKEKKAWLNIFRSTCRQNKAVVQIENKAKNETRDDLLSTSSDELSNESSSNDSKGHSREISMLSTTPFASLQDDIAACLFQAGITENIKARAFLEKERQLEESYKKQKEAQEQRMRSTMNTSGVEQINSDKNDNQKVDWIKIVGCGTHVSSKGSDCQSHDGQFAPRMIRSLSTSSHIFTKESLRQSHYEQLVPNMVKSQSVSSVSSASCQDPLPAAQPKTSPRKPSLCNQEPSTSNGQNAHELGKLVTVEQTDKTGDTALQLLHGKHRRYGSFIKSRNLLKRFGSFNQEEKEFIKQVFETEHETSARDLFDAGTTKVC